MAWQQKGFYAAFAVFKQDAKGGRHKFVQREHTKIVQPALLRGQQGCGHRGSCGLKAYTQKNHRIAGVGGGKSKGVEGRIDNFYARALRLRMLERKAVGTGYAQKVAKCGYDNAVAPCKVKKGRHFGIVCDTHRAAGAGKVGYR